VRRLLPLVAIAAAIAVLAPDGAAAQTFTVTDLADSGGGSLRLAVSEANSNSGADLIVFASGLNGTINLQSTGLVISESVDIEGPGPGIVAVRQTDPAHRVFQVHRDESKPVTIAGLRLEGGTANGSGGPLPDYGGDLIDEGAVLTLSNDVISDGHATEGGGVYATESELTLIDTVVSSNEATNAAGVFDGGVSAGWSIVGSTISGNVATDGAGGVELATELVGTVEGSTIAGNRAKVNGAGELEAIAGGRVVVRNSTIAANTASSELGGFRAGTAAPQSSFTIESTTIVGNKAPAEAGGVVVSSASALLIANSILWGNLKGSTESDLFSEASGADTAFDLIGHQNLFQMTETVPGSNLFGVDPQLGPLAANGGPTATMAPASTSPAINAGSSGLAADQRGAARPVAYPGVAFSVAPGANGADIGAYELQPPAAAAAPSPGTGTPPIAPIGKSRPRGVLHLGKVKLNLKSGTATVALSVSGRGVVRLLGSRRLRGSSHKVGHAGTVHLLVRARGAAARALYRDRQVKVVAVLRFTARGAAPVTRSLALRLKLAPGA
jgi:hypothetical protein